MLCLPVKCTSIERKVALRNLNNIFGLFSEHSLHHCTDCFVNDADIKIISSSYLRISNFAECRMQFTGFYGQFPPCCNSPLFALDAKASTKNVRACSLASSFRTYFGHSVLKRTVAEKIFREVRLQLVFFYVAGGGVLFSAFAARFAKTSPKDPILMGGSTTSRI